MAKGRRSRKSKDSKKEIRPKAKKAAEPKAAKKAVKPAPKKKAPKKTAAPKAAKKKVATPKATRLRKPKIIKQSAPLPSPKRLPGQGEIKRSKQVEKELRRLGVAPGAIKKALKNVYAEPKMPKADRVQARSEAWRMRETLEIAKEQLLERKPSLDVTYRVRANPDGVVTGELRVAGWPKNMSASTLSYFIEDAIGDVPQGHWISAGARFQFPADKRAEYKRRGDMASVSAHYQPEQPQRVFLAIRDILANMKKRRRPAPEEIIVRMQWNALNLQPRRKF